MRSGKRAHVESVELDFGSVPAQGDAEQTVFVNGVSGSAMVLVAAPDLESGLMVSGYANGGQVTVRLSNVTANPVDPALQDFNIVVIQ